MSVAVIMPAYNARRHLEAAVRSVLSQSHQDWQLVIVDDGSTDGTWQLATQLASTDDRIDVVRQSNQGQGAARNLGASRCHQPWLAFLDADDVWHSQALAALLNPIREADVVFGTAVEFRGDELPAMRREPRSSREARPLRLQGAAGVIRLIRRNLVPLSATLVRRATFLTVGGFDSRPELRNVEDYHLWLRMLAAGYTLQQQPEAVLYYRLHETNASRRRLEMKGRRALALRDVPLRHPLTWSWRALKVLELRLSQWRQSHHADCDEAVRRDAA